MTPFNPMQDSFDKRVESAWSESEWIIDDMFTGGMCLLEGYIPRIDLTALESSLAQLTDTEVDCQDSYISYIRSGRILMLHVDYAVVFANYTFRLKLIFDPNTDLEDITQGALRDPGLRSETLSA